MNDAALIFRFGESCGYGFFDSGESVRTDKQDIFYTSVFQLVKYRKPRRNLSRGFSAKKNEFIEKYKSAP